MDIQSEIVVFDCQKQKIVKAKDSKGIWWTLKGKCNRCGWCCLASSKETCKNLYWEYIDNKKIAGCKVHMKEKRKPWPCVLYPRYPEDKLPDTCGFYWIKE